MCGKVKLVIIAQTILIPNGGKARTHDGESGKGRFYYRWIVLEMCALPAGIL
jgi:hypothetical protein